MQRSTLLTIAGTLMIIATIIMLFYWFVFFNLYASSVAYYNTANNYAALYSGIWNSCALPFTLVGTIFLFKKKHVRLCILGIALTLVSGFVPAIIFTVVNNYATYVFDGLELGAPLIILSATALILALLGQRNVTKQQANP
jgi:hypothetical protein